MSLLDNWPKFESKKLLIISSNNAIKHSISIQRGIQLNDSIKNYYDSINFSQATWNGTW